MTRDRVRYLFGDTDLAARRLERVHEIFAASSETFVRTLRAASHTRTSSCVAVDVGCGIGCTTEMVRRALAADIVIGIDLSTAFLGLARSHYPGCLFVRADVATDLPVQQAGLVYARYVLSHLPNATATVARWLSVLAPGGRLLIEENLGYETANNAFARYMHAVDEVMRANGQDLYVGRAVRLWTPPLGFRVVHATERRVDAAAAAVGAIFSMNFPAWRERATRFYAPAWLDELGVSLRTPSTSAGAPMTWKLLQLAVERER